MYTQKINTGQPFLPSTYLRGEKGLVWATEIFVGVVYTLDIFFCCNDQILCCHRQKFSWHNQNNGWIYVSEVVGWSNQALLFVYCNVLGWALRFWVLIHWLRGILLNQWESLRISDKSLVYALHQLRVTMRETQWVSLTLSCWWPKTSFMFKLYDRL